MKIKITTEREILKQDFWDWIEELNNNGIPINGKEFNKNGVFEFSDDLGYTKATTRYEILK